jgi:formylglycine-generating enzyme required for sulfatase activity
MSKSLVLSITPHYMLRRSAIFIGKLGWMLGLYLSINIAYAEEFINFIGMPFVDLPGSNLQVEKTEITLGQFKHFSGARGSDQFETVNRYGDDAPVAFVSWNDAGQFIDWLNRSKPASDAGTYRLPSEAEWETACRAGANRLYCGGDEPDAIGWFDQNSGYRPHPVAGKQPNAFGLHDMSGNVAEWTATCWLDGPAATPSGGNCAGRVVRGASWLSYDGIALGSERYFEAPASRSYVIGFRVVRVITR